MRDHRHTVDAQEEGPAELAPVGPAPDRPQLGPDEHTTEGRQVHDAPHKALY